MLYVKVIQDMYNEARMNVKVCVEKQFFDESWCPLGVGFESVFVFLGYG